MPRNSWDTSRGILVWNGEAVASHRGQDIPISIRWVLFCAVHVVIEAKAGCKQAGPREPVHPTASFLTGHTPGGRAGTRSAPGTGHWLAGRSRSAWVMPAWARRLRTGSAGLLRAHRRAGAGTWGWGGLRDGAGWGGPGRARRGQPRLGLFRPTLGAEDAPSRAPALPAQSRPGPVRTGRRVPWPAVPGPAAGAAPRRGKRPGAGAPCGAAGGDWCRQRLRPPVRPAPAPGPGG